MLRKNWKLIELAGRYNVISNNCREYEDIIFDTLNLPVEENKQFHKGESNIYWDVMPVHEAFFFDYEGNENVKDLLKKSELGKYNNIIITFCHDNLVISIDMSLFFEEWEDIFASTLYNALLFSPDYKLIMEITRDYYLHSNFPIKK